MRGGDEMSNGIAVIVRKRKELGDEMFGCLKACVEHNVRMAEQNKKAPSVRDEAKGNMPDKKSVETATE